MEKLLHEESVNKDYAEKLQLEQSRNEDLLKHSAERMNVRSLFRGVSYLLPASKQCPHL